MDKEWILDKPWIQTNSCPQQCTWNRYYHLHEIRSEADVE